jgi:glucose/arabinose dehydrogenase
MKKKQRETKSRCGFGLTRYLIGGVMCLAVISLICSRASAQNLFAVDAVQGNYGNIDEFTPNGVRSTFAFGLNYPAGLAFDQAGNLFVADGGAIYKFTPAGVRTTFALGLSNPAGLAFDSAGNLFAAEFGEINGKARSQ